MINDYWKVEEEEITAWRGFFLLFSALNAFIQIWNNGLVLCKARYKFIPQTSIKSCSKIFAIITWYKMIILKKSFVVETWKKLRRSNKTKFLVWYKQNIFVKMFEFAFYKLKNIISKA